ncbi:hypothetical protein [Mycolicibacterium llatzerense]|uniref:hypothetical protein n=1 Tax=Mycolicibacterium llatzerense TaxID=280871 RepID=UPI0021B52349|nr:hypothetical protein [Mycolicibacterium llatzerense]
MASSNRAIEGPSSAQIVDALRAAGWLLEQEADTALVSRGYATSVGAAFPDPDDPTKSREIDVMAYKRLHSDEELRVSVGIRCLVECKQTSNPYVLIGKPTDEFERTRPRLEEVYRFDQVVIRREPIGANATRLYNTDARTYLRLNDLREAPWNHGFLANQMTQLERKAEWIADNRGIFDSLVYPLAKATQHYRSQRQTSRVVHDRSRDWASIQFLYPMVVTSAPLYKVDVSAEPYEPKLVDWVPMVREIRSGTLNGRYVIDTVHAGALGSYLDEHIGPFAADLQRLAQDDAERFITSGYEEG